MKKIIRCCYCDAILSKDEIGATQKFIHREIKQFMCYSCLAEFVDCTVDELKCQIERFKEEDCGLFK
ncbi:hypothetical protein MKMG_00718 [Methanogenium sp. MK-MG]|nr:hypothetical protein MKMG_00718 [Methanogenium sp. MK-MG]